MAIAKMTKVMIACHLSQAQELLDVLQQEGIVQILDAEKAMVSKEWPELQVEVQRARDFEEMVARLEKSISFLSGFAAGQEKKSIFNPFSEVEHRRYVEIVSGQKALRLLEQAESVETEMEKLRSEHENCRETLGKLMPWVTLESTVEELTELKSTTCFAGFLPQQHIKQVMEKLAQLGAAAQQFGTSGSMVALLAVCIIDSSADVQKALRECDFEAVSFEGMKGKVSELISGYRSRLADIQAQIELLRDRAAELAKERIGLEVLYDHHRNLLSREQIRRSVPVTEHVILLEGWVRQKDYGRLEEAVSKFNGASIGRMEAGAEEDVPVEIVNKPAIRPFEVITRLYGMPAAYSVDPTVFLAPFFAIFFGMCLSDAGYGLIMVVILAWVLKKMRAGKGIIWMLLICSVLTFAVGAATGSWFGDSLSTLIPQDSSYYRTVNNLREKIMLFDPMKDPMKFFGLSIGLGYLQIQVGLLIGFFHALLKKDYISAVCDKLSWIILLNCLLVIGLSKGGILPAGLAKISALTTIAPAIVIFLFSERSGSWGGRIGIGAFQLFSTVFYMGDILSYVRLMALGMVGAGFGMAINVLVKLMMQVPYVGFILGAIVFVGGHSFNLAMSTLGAFVHTMRLQFVEFFPKFLSGEGREFRPLCNEYKYISFKQE